MNTFVRIAAAGILTLLASSAHASTFLAFTPAPAAAGAAPAAPGACIADQGLAQGSLSGSSAGSPCHAGGWGAETPAAFAGDTRVHPESTASFATVPLAGDLHLGGAATLAFAHRTQDTYSGVPATYKAPRFSYALLDLGPSGQETTIAQGAGDLESSALDNVRRSSVAFGVPAYVVAAGHQLAVRMTSTDAPDTQVYYAGEYSDSGITIETDDAKGGSSALTGITAGALSPLTGLPLLGLAALSRRRRA